MSDRFCPISMEQLTSWIFDELAQGSLFGIPKDLFFKPQAADRFRSSLYGHLLETPFGVAAGPHSQMAQNIIIAWLCGGRFIELKTIQTLDELEVSKPCIDAEDEGYNCEWSQELKIHQSFDEYLRAWVLIHALHRKLGFPGDAPGMIFNLSAGYNLEGVKKDNVQWYLKKVTGAPEETAKYIELVAKHCPEIRDIHVPTRMSDSITLSTMHGCPPHEIEAISQYLIDEWNFHTNVKLNPTLLGAERVRRILNDQLGFKDTWVPDEAFGHDLRYEDAVPMLRRLLARSQEKGLTFGVKLTNTLESVNHRTVFPPHEKMMYMSGRPLFAISTNVAAKLSEEFRGELPMSYAGGADAFNVSELLAAGMKTVTVCTDLLKTGGYLRLRQYTEETAATMDRLGANDLSDLAVRTAAARDGFADAFVAKLAPQAEAHGKAVTAADAARLATTAQKGDWRAAAGDLADEAHRACVRLNLATVAATAPTAHDLTRGRFVTWKSKTDRKLGLFDCVAAPCTDECPVDQDVPAYMRAVREGRFGDAVQIARKDSPMPATLGRICDRKCQDTCIRTHLDEPLAIREMKRFILSKEQVSQIEAKPTQDKSAKVALIGAGPCGIATARELARAGYPCTIFEQYEKAGGMVSGTIPAYRLPQSAIDQDLRALTALGVEIRYGKKAGRDFTLEQLTEQGFKYVVLGLGAQAGRRLGLPGDDAAGVFDAITFLRQVRDGNAPAIGPKVVVIGAGDVAMDSARSAFRLGADVHLVYRRTIAEMPADPEEIEGLLEEGITVHELMAPESLTVENGQVRALTCQKMRLGEKGADGRRRPEPVEGERLTLPVDTLLMAVSQAPVLDFFGANKPTLTRGGNIQVDTALETSVPNVFSGGDVADQGAASAVKACGDGKRIAATIRAREESVKPEFKILGVPELHRLIERRAHREFRVALPHRSADDRRNFEEVMFTLDDATAQAEASRCLDCDTICSICVSVCPNRAILTYLAEPFVAHLPEIVIQDGVVGTSLGETFRLDQSPQVAVVTDFCNECGNCRTFCPTAGRPYADKPRLYFSLSEFEAQADNAFRVVKGEGRFVISGRFGGETHTLTLGDDLTYQRPGLEAVLAPKTLTVLNLYTTSFEDRTVSLKPAAILYGLGESLRTSQAHLPSA